MEYDRYEKLLEIGMEDKNKETDDAKKLAGPGTVEREVQENRYRKSERKDEESKHIHEDTESATEQNSLQKI